jgi:hypothetical protein
MFNRTMKWQLRVTWFVTAAALFSGAVILLNPFTARTGNVSSYADIFAPEKSDTTALSGLLGGEFTFTNASGTTADFNAPQNFYSDNVELQISSYPPEVYEGFRPPPTGSGFAGKIYDFILRDLSSGDLIATTSEPIEVVLHYLETDVSGLDERTLAPYRREGDEFTWTLIPGSTVNTADDAVSFSTDHFSAFALIASPPSPPTPSTPPASPLFSGGGSTGSGGGIGYLTTSTRPRLLPVLLLPVLLQFADLNGDSRIDVVDLSVLLFYFNQTGEKISRYDLNGDGIIDVADISILMYYWTS